ncbi:FAD/NAD(P)-binding oxidoreductase [Streptomyces sp. M19]
MTLLDSAEQPGGQYHRMLPAAYAAARPDLLHHGWHAFDRRVRRVLGHPGAPGGRRPPSGRWSGPSPARRGRPWCTYCAARRTARGAPATYSPRRAGARYRRHDRTLPFPGWELPGSSPAARRRPWRRASGWRWASASWSPVPGRSCCRWPPRCSRPGRGCGKCWRRAAPPPWRAAGCAALGLAAHLGKAGELAGYAAELARHRVPFRPARGVVEVRGEDRVEEVVSARLRADWSVVPGTERVTSADAVCVTHGFTRSSNCRSPLAAPCAGLRRPALKDATDATDGTDGTEGTNARDVADAVVAVDDAQRTSCPGCSRPVRSPESRVRPRPAPRAPWPGGRRRAAPRRPYPARPPARPRPGPVLRRTAGLGAPRRRRVAGLAAPETVICRCEETDYATVRRAADDAVDAHARVAKLATRAGLGPCQARVCGPTVAELRAARAAGHRWRGLPDRTRPRRRHARRRSAPPPHRPAHQARRTGPAAGALRPPRRPVRTHPGRRVRAPHPGRRVRARLPGGPVPVRTHHPGRPARPVSPDQPPEERS